MLLAQTTTCANKYGELKSIELIAKAGFDAVDFSLFDLRNEDYILNSDNYKSYVNQLCETAKRNNVVFVQAHATSSVPAPDAETSYNLMVKHNAHALEICSLMGIEHLVIHPFGLDDYIGNEEESFERNIKYFRTLLPYAEKYGVKMAVENMWCGDRHKKVTRGSICSNPYEHAYYVDTIGSEMFVACLDVGHSSLAGREAQDVIRVLGNRLEALHIHDNDYLDDMHTLPGLSEMNWEEITRALADINYSGAFTFETDHFFDSFEDIEETETGMKLACLIGRKMIKKIEKYSSSK